MFIIEVGNISDRQLLSMCNADFVSVAEKLWEMIEAAKQSDDPLVSDMADAVTLLRVITRSDVLHAVTRHNEGIAG